MSDIRHEDALEGVAIPEMTHTFSQQEQEKENPSQKSDNPVCKCQFRADHWQHFGIFGQQE